MNYATRQGVEKTADVACVLSEAARQFSLINIPVNHAGVHAFSANESLSKGEFRRGDIDSSFLSDASLVFVRLVRRSISTLVLIPSALGCAKKHVELALQSDTNAS